MKKIVTLLVMLFVLCGVQVVAQTDYYVAHGADVNVSHSTHYPNPSFTHFSSHFLLYKGICEFAF